MPATYSAALYLRLSKDDDDAKSESSSIQSQRKMLTSYAQEKGFPIYDYYVDDGYSGTNFERPQFNRLLSDIDNAKVNMIIIKDLSRLGRDYIITGQYTEIIFPLKGVRCIAINDGYDSINPNNDIVPFKNVMNEMYARDISKKIRSGFAARINDGAYIGNFAPYGYKKDPNDKHHLIPDEHTAPVVRQIFDMAAQGKNYIEIARTLNDRGVLSPLIYRCSIHERATIDKYNVTRHEWTASGVRKICVNQVYLGHTLQGKTTKVSFKSKLTKAKDRSEWVIVHNTHQALIDTETFEIVGRISRSRTCVKDTRGFSNVFSGLAVCADCGRSMSTVGSRKQNSPYNLACGGYKLYGSAECTNHFIEYNTLYDLVLNAINEQIQMSQVERNALIDELHKAEKVSASKAATQKELKALRSRLKEIDRLIEKSYVDKVNGLLSEARFKKLLDSFEAESLSQKQKIASLEKSCNSVCESEQASQARFEKLISQYNRIDVLTPDLLFKLIERIEVSQGSYEKTLNGKTKNQTIRIFFRFQATPTIRYHDL